MQIFEYEYIMRKRECQFILYGGDDGVIRTTFITLYPRRSYDFRRLECARKCAILYEDFFFELDNTLFVVIEFLFDRFYSLVCICNDRFDHTNI